MTNNLDTHDTNQDDPRWYCHCEAVTDSCFCTVESHARTVGREAVGDWARIAQESAYTAAMAVFEAIDAWDHVAELAKPVEPDDDPEGEVWREVVGIEEPFDVLASIVGYISNAFGSVFPSDPAIPADVVRIRQEQLTGHRANDGCVGRSWLLELQIVRRSIEAGDMRGSPVAVEQMARRIEVDEARREAFLNAAGPR